MDDAHTCKPDASDAGERWAHGDEAAGDALLARDLPWLVARLAAVAPTEQVSNAARRLLARGPRFTVSSIRQFRGLLERMVRNMLASHGESLALQAAGSGPVLRLDQPAHEAPSSMERDKAFLRLGLLLLDAADQEILQAHWEGCSDREIAGRSNLPEARVAAQRQRVVARHKSIVGQLKVGDIEGCLAEQPAFVDRWGGCDPWGASTQWSMVLGANAAKSTEMQQSWRRLVERYRTPIRDSVRRALRGRPEAEDVASDFFTYLFEHRLLAKADPDKGRFRAYIQAILKLYLRKRHLAEPALAQLDTQLDSQLAQAPAADALELEEERAWAAHVLEMALEALMQRAPRDGEILVRYYGVPWAGAVHSPHTRDEIAAALGISTNAVDQANHRARRALREYIHAELRETVASAADAQAELAWLERRLLEAYPGLLTPGRDATPPG